MQNREKKYNILFVATTQNYYYDNQASFTRMYNNLMYFHKNKNFNVFVLQPDFYRDKEKRKLKQDIKTFYFKQIRILNYTLVPFTDFNPFYIKKIKNVIQKYKIDLIHVDYPYGIIILRFITKIPVSYNSYNVEYIFTNQVYKYYYRLPKIFRSIYTKYIYFLEKFLLKFVNNINTVSEFDKRELIRIYNTPEQKIFLNPFGYNKKVFENRIKKQLARINLELPQDKFIIIFHGDLFFHANLEAINFIKEKVLPKIKDKNIIFLIAGKKPNHLKNNYNLKFLGYVDDLNSFLYSADIAMTPIFRGSGVKTKCIDYLSAKIPIISTKRGIEGLFFYDNVHGYIIDNCIDNFIERVIFLKNNPNKIELFKENIEALLKEKYNWDLILNRLARRYRKLIFSTKTKNRA